MLGTLLKGMNINPDEVMAQVRMIVTNSQEVVSGIRLLLARQDEVANRLAALETKVCELTKGNSND